MERKAFTLAEVLITLGIIGVVAAMTMPTLMNNISDTQAKTAYKKVYSVANQAWMMAYANNSLTVCSSWTDGPCNISNFDAFKANIKVSKDCANNTADCWDMSGEKLFGNLYPASDASAFIDTSGVAWAKLRNVAGTTPEVVMDVNGFKKPNQFGVDRFLFNLALVVDVPNNINITSPRINLYYDCDGVVPADYPAATVAAQSDRCPSMSKHPCYYKSWITGDK